MRPEKNTDILGAGNKKILLFQPQTTVKQGQITDASSSMDAVSMEEAFRDAFHLKALIHVCSIDCEGRNNKFVDPYALGPKCGGFLTLKQVHESRLYKGLCHDGLEFMLTCSNPECKMDLLTYAYPTRQMFSDAILHLMLKQMVPELETANYIDCNKRENDFDIYSSISAKENEEIKKIGLFSLLVDAFWGNINNGYFNSPMPRRYSFGFMLKPGMKTISGCDGYSNWLQFLIKKKFERLQEYHQSTLPLLIGPKRA